MGVLMHRVVIHLFLFLTLLPAVSMAGAAQQQVFKVAIDIEYPPYEFVDTDGTVKGMLPDLLRAIGKRAGVQFEFLPMDWPDAVASLNNGKVDLVNMIRTPQRIGKFEFSEPHSHIHQALFRNRHHDDIHDVASIAGSRIALQRFDIAVEKLSGRDYFDRIMVDKKQDGFLMLNSGKVAAFFAAEQPGLYFLRRHQLPNVEIAAIHLFPQPYCFTAKKGNRSIIGLLNRELKQLKQTGEFARIIKPWLIAPPSWLQMHKQEVEAALLMLLLLVIGFVLWNVQLRRTVKRQMTSLQEEHQRLLESEAYRRTLFEQSPVGLALCRMDGALVDINQAFADIIGRSVEQTLPLSYWDITPEEYKQQEQRQLQLLEEKGSYGPYEKAYLHRDGHRVPVRLNGVIFERDGERFIWFSIEDITHEKEQQALLAEQAEEMRAVIDHSPNGIIVTDMDANICRANPAATAIFGYQEAEFQHMTIHDLVPDEIRKKHPAFFNAEVNGKHHQIINRTRELRGQRSDGSCFPCNITVGQFKVAGKRMFSVLIQDLTKRKQAEQQRNRLAAILESTSDFVGMADIEGHTLYVNRAGRRMMGFGEDEDLSGLAIADYHSPEVAERMQRDIFPVLEREGMWHGENVFLARDGREIVTDQVLIAQRGATGEIDVFSTIARDMTDMKDMQAKIEHSQRLESLGVLAGGIAHDFNNILTAILGNAALAERKALSKPMDTQRHLSNIVVSSEKAAELCKQMLAYSGKGRFVVKALDISAMVEEISRLLEVSIAKNVVLKYHLPENLPAVEADAAQLQQVIMNLVINASDAIGDNSGVISIGTGVMHADNAYLAGSCLDDKLPEGRYVYLEVSDTGCGMDQITQEKIFEPFFTTKFTGHGLGMSAVLGIVRGHRGAMKLYSEPGRGTTFKVLLPASDQQSEPVSEQLVSGDAWHGSGAVLIVDDEESIRETAAVMLEDMGFTTLVAVNGKDGVDVYRSHQSEIVAVLLDMTMPKMDGKTCFSELKRINPDVQVVLSSGYNEQEATSLFAGKGLAGFIQKPYLPESLEASLRQIIQKDIE